MTEILNPLTALFRAVLDELRRRLTPEKFADLLKECSMDPENEGTGANTISTPEQTPAPVD